jgi:hypothetical protein
LALVRFVLAAARGRRSMCASQTGNRRCQTLI